MSGLKGKVVVITGGSAGIGAACGREFAKYGTKLVLTGRNHKALADVTQQCLDNGATQVVPVIADLTKDDDVKSIVHETLKAFGTIHILVNNVGGFSPDNTSFKLDYASPTTVVGPECHEFDYQYKVCVRAPWQLCGMFVDELIKNKGNIINISSTGAIVTFPHSRDTYAYATMKAAMNYMTKCMATELGMKGVRVNCKMPGSVKTSVLRNVGTEQQQRDTFDAMAKQIHVLKQKVMEPIDIAKSVIFLASDDAARITGVILPVDCGLLLGSPAYDFTGGQSSTSAGTE